MIGTEIVHRKVNLTETGIETGSHGLHFYTVEDGDNGTFQWNFHGIDRAEMHSKDTELDQITALAFSDFNASLQRLSVISQIREPQNWRRLISWPVKSEDAFDYNNESIHVLKSGDNLTLSFTTDESVDEQSLHPDLMIGTENRSSMSS